VGRNLGINVNSGGEVINELGIQKESGTARRDDIDKDL